MNSLAVRDIQGKSECDLDQGRIQGGGAGWSGSGSILQKYAWGGFAGESTDGREQGESRMTPRAVA